MKKISIIIACVIFFIIILTVRVNAVDEACKISISADKTELKKGDTVTINVLISNVTTTSGIGSFYGILDYPEDIFEIIPDEDESIKADYEEYAEYTDYSILYSGRQDDDITIENPWYMILVKEENENGFIASVDSEFLEDIEPVKQGESQIVGRIKLKVKDNVASTTTAKIALTEMKAFELGDSNDSSEDEDLTENELSDATLNLTIKGTAENSGTSNQNQNSNQKQDDNKAKSDVPYTGIEDIIPVILIIIIIAILSYIGYRKYKDI